MRAPRPTSQTVALWMFCTGLAFGAWIMAALGAPVRHALYVTAGAAVMWVLVAIDLIVTVVEESR